MTRTIAAGQLPFVPSIIAGQMMKCVMATVVCFAVTWQAAYAAQPEHSTESVAAIRDLRGGREGARRYIWPR